MTQKSLQEQQEAWLGRVWSAYKGQWLMMLCFIVGGTWLMPWLIKTMAGDVAVLIPMVAWFDNLPWAYVAAAMTLFVLVMALPLALASTGPYPTQTQFELNAQLRAAWLKSKETGGGTNLNH